jgi:hypothetical protein
MTYDQVERLLELTASAVNNIDVLVAETKRHNVEMERLLTSIAHVDDSDLEAFYRKPAWNDADLQRANEAYMSKHAATDSPEGFAIPPVPAVPGKPSLSVIENAALRADAFAFRHPPVPVVRWAVCDEAGNEIGFVRGRDATQAHDQALAAYGLTAAGIKRAD